MSIISSINYRVFHPKSCGATHRSPQCPGDLLVANPQIRSGDAEARPLRRGFRPQMQGSFPKSVLQFLYTYRRHIPTQLYIYIYIHHIHYIHIYACIYVYPIWVLWTPCDMWGHWLLKSRAVRLWGATCWSGCCFVPVEKRPWAQLLLSKLHEALNADSPSCQLAPPGRDLASTPVPSLPPHTFERRWPSRARCERLRLLTRQRCVNVVCHCTCIR